MNAQQVAERLIAARQTAAGGTTPDGARTPLEAYRDELATYTAALRTAPLETLEAVLDWYATEVALARDSVNEGQARRWRLTRTSYLPANTVRAAEGLPPLTPEQAASYAADAARD